MSNYSLDLKIKVVQEYEKGMAGCEVLAKQNGISNESVVRRWVNAYRTLGVAGLAPKSKTHRYPFSLKKNVVECYLTTNNSSQTVANLYRLPSASLVQRWVKSFEKNGLDGLAPEHKREWTMPKKTKKSAQKNTQTTPQNTQKTLEQTNKELTLRVEHLEAELAFLKELRRLRQADTKKQQNVSAGSSITSDDPTD